MADSCQGWSPAVGRELPIVIEAFDRVAAGWGWENLARAEPDRTAYRDERFAWFREEFERPYYEAAISAQPKFRGFDDVADEGRRKGFAASMTPEEGAARFPDARRAMRTAHRLGKMSPEVAEAEETALSQSYHLLKAAVDEAAPPAWPTPSQPIMSPEMVAWHRKEATERSASIGRLKARFLDAVELNERRKIQAQIDDHRLWIITARVTLTRAGFDLGVADDWLVAAPSEPEAEVAVTGDALPEAPADTLSALEPKHEEPQVSPPLPNRLILGGPDDKVILCGKEKDPLPPAQYRVVKALVEAKAQGKRVSKDELCNRTKDERGDVVEDPVGALERLCRRDPDWSAVIDMAKVPGRGYGLKDCPPTPT